MDTIYDVIMNRWSWDVAGDDWWYDEEKAQFIYDQAVLMGWDALVDAFDSKSNEDAQRELANMVYEETGNPKPAQYVNSVDWVSAFWVDATVIGSRMKKRSYLVPMTWSGIEYYNGPAELVYDEQYKSWVYSVGEWILNWHPNMPLIAINENTGEQINLTDKLMDGETFDSLYYINQYPFMRTDSWSMLKMITGSNTTNIGGKMKNKRAYSPIQTEPGWNDFNKRTNDWFGIPGATFVYHNDYADPDIVYNGVTLNYWDVMDAMWDFAQEDGITESITDEEYDEWLEKNVDLLQGVLDDYAWSMQDAGRTTWHNAKKGNKMNKKGSFWEHTPFFDNYVDLEVEMGPDDDAWNNASREERFEMVRPIVKKYIELYGDSTVWPLFFDDLEDNNYHTEYKVFMEELGDRYAKKANKRRYVRKAMRKKASGWEPRIFIGYVNAPAVGDWIELPADDMDAEMERIKKIIFDEVGEEWGIQSVEDVEYMIPDYEGLGDQNAADMEWQDPYDINEAVQEVMDAGAYLPDEIVEWALGEYGFNDAARALSDIYYIEADDEEDLAYKYIEEVYGDISGLGKETLEQYFDYKHFGRELAWDFTEVDGYYVHVGKKGRKTYYVKKANKQDHRKRVSRRVR